MNLPLDRPRPPRQTHHGSAERLDVGPDLVRGLDDIARKAGATRFMILLSAYTVLLHRYCNQEDILVGTPVAGRNLRDIEPLIGFFVNTLVIRTDLSEDLTFRNLLDQVRRTSVAAFEHQDLPFEKLVDALQPERTLSHSPVFQTMFVLHNAHTEALNLPGLTIRPMEAETVSAQFDLVLSVLEVESGFHMRFEYNTDLFDPGTIRRMADNFEVLLSGIAAHPESKVSELPILTARERHRLLVEFNDTAADYPDDKSIVDLFEAQVEQTPDAPAVVFEDRRLSYWELNRAANRVAHFLLKECEIRQEDRIGVFLERSERPTVAMLGVMKAGGAYLPLDPSYPKDRLRYMIDDSGCSVLLTESGTKDALRELSDSVRLVDVQELPEFKADNPRTATGPNHLAYVIYTSGSTGRPKGVMVEHGGFVNMAFSHISLIGITGEDRILQFSTCSFDASMYETFIALFSGSALICVQKSTINDPEKLINEIQKSQVTAALIPPSYIPILGFEGLRNLRILVTGGESALSDDGLFADSEHHYWNAYGPTEYSVIATSYPIPPHASDQSNIPIGKPLLNTQILILRPAGNNLQPIGAPGEICIAGAGLARGYCNKPELTAEKFTPQPFAPSHRMYRSGDLGRWRPNGNIEFLGRCDDQVKIRGYRIELGEIENRLLSHPSVKGAVVLSKTVYSQTSELIAYVLLKDECNVNDLKDYLKQSLPSYMIPAFFIRMDRFPLTPNGKVDKKNLPTEIEAGLEIGSTYAAPRSQAETVMTSVWSDVIGRDRIGIRDNYFTLGGDSIKAIQVSSRLRDFGWKLDIQDLFKFPTVEQLAPHLQPYSPESPVSEDLSGNLPLSPAQKWFFETVSRERHHFNQAMLLRGKPHFRIKALKRAFSAIW
ncbi:MAG: non-ribosomal peptide synthetase, partial [Thermodesulfobacteriota bacterium]